MLNRLLVVALMVAFLLGLGPASAIADLVECPSGQQPNPVTGHCVILVAGGGGGGGRGGSGRGSGGGGGGGSAPKCFWANAEIPCNDQGGYWSDGRLCYISPSLGGYPPDSWVWEGNHPRGAIYTCYNPFLIGTRAYDFWSLSQPSGPTAPPDPRDLAQLAVASMQLSAINIGLVPEPRAGSVGLVGMPNWMWVDAPSANTWGPITRSASAAGFTVTATARVGEVTWDMGDGQVVACGAGTAYQDSFGRQASPTCGHTYTRQGKYTVRATSRWVITWSGIGQTGTLTMDLSQTAPVTIGEAQVLRQ